MTEDEIRELFRVMRDEPAPAESLARVRFAVAERTERTAARRRFWFRWGIAALVPACLLLVLMLGLRKETPPVPAAQVAPVERRIPIEEAVPPPEPLHPRRALEVSRPARSEPAARNNLVIRIETPDPDVVILLVGDTGET